MKAKEYYKKFLGYEKAFGEKQAFARTWLSFAAEVADIAKKRNAESDQALISILRELNQKWNAITQLDPRFKWDGFIEYMKVKMPFLKDALEKRKK